MHVEQCQCLGCLQRQRTRWGRRPPYRAQPAGRSQYGTCRGDGKQSNGISRGDEGIKEEFTRTAQLKTPASMTQHGLANPRDPGARSRATRVPGLQAPGPMDGPVGVGRCTRWVDGNQTVGSPPEEGNQSPRLAGAHFAVRAPSRVWRAERGSRSVKVWLPCSFGNEHTLPATGTSGTS